MPRIAIVDTNYQSYLDSLPSPLLGDYETELARHLSRGFGTYDCYSFYLKQEGWETLDIVANYTELQKRWAMEHGWTDGSNVLITLQQIEDFRPDCVLMQDLSFFDAATLEFLRRKYLLVGQCSCPMPAAEKVSKFHTLFTSFPHYVERFKALGVQAHYLPLAFDPRMLSEESTQKQFDISFVGGVGKRSHWKAGTEMLERVAGEFRESFVWFGYGRENLVTGSPLIRCYGGPCFGREMYRVYGRSKIVIARHGEVAEGYSNNLRMFEATGMGAMLLTERSKNLNDLFGSEECDCYEDGDDLIGSLTLHLEDEILRSYTAKNGQARTLKHHTYAHRMKVVSDVLTAALVGQAA